jgi:hypothetical protein
MRPRAFWELRQAKRDRGTMPLRGGQGGERAAQQLLEVDELFAAHGNAAAAQAFLARAPGRPFSTGAVGASAAGVWPAASGRSRP